MVKKEKCVRIDIAKAKVGDKVVVADYVGTQVYTISELGDGAAEGNYHSRAQLSYPMRDGTMVSGGWHPMAAMYVPTKAQLEHVDN